MDDIKTLMRRALSDRSGAWDGTRPAGTTTRSSFWPKSCDGDARRACRRWKSACCPATSGRCAFTRDLAEESVQRKAVAYDADRRRALRCRQRLDQEHARQRSGRGAVLAGPHARRGRRRAIPLPDESSFWPARTSATPTRRRCRWRWPPCKPASSSACRSASSRWPRR